MLYTLFIFKLTTINILISVQVGLVLLQYTFNFPSFHLRHSSFSYPSVATSQLILRPSVAPPTSQLIFQPLFRFSYVTCSSLTSHGEPPMVFECTERSADRSSSSAVSGLWPHTARRSTHLLQEFGWEVFNHPPYSPDLAPSDLHFFLHLKKFLPGHRQRFLNNREALMSVTVVPIPDGRVLRHRIQKLFPRYDKCVSSGGEYVEK